MRALILSDIHSNIDALEAVLAAAPAHDVVWNLGDVVGYNAAPMPVVERVRELGNFFVRGNHDRACCGLTDAENFNPIARAAVEWTKRQLSDDALQWLRDLPRGPLYPSTETMHIGPKSPAPLAASSGGESEVACVHGSPFDEDEYLLSMHDARPLLRQASTRIAFFGHTHVQGGFAANATGECFEISPAYSSDDKEESYELDLREDATYLINPGSVGQPRDRDWRAAFAVYDDTARRIAYIRTPYDVHLAQMRIHRAGLPDKLAARLQIGR